nr:DUF1156 domain-containing protein [Roseisolibacter agri]
MIAPKKLIEVALPLDTINEAASREKAIRSGHPSALHHYWARRPLAAARAVIFAQVVNDPSWRWEYESPGQEPPSHLKATWAKSRRRLFGILQDLVRWESSTDAALVERARSEIRKSWRETCEANRDHPFAAELFDPDVLPALHDPFAGGGAIPLEGQRLGLEAFASDLNPVAVLINKAMLEIPQRFNRRPPVRPEVDTRALIEREWHGAQGVAEDVRYYGAWVLERARERAGLMFQAAPITAETVRVRPDLVPYVGQTLPIIAWIWANTVKSPNPAFAHVDVPLVSTYVLSAKSGKEAFLVPVVSGDQYRFEVCVGKQPTADARAGTKLGRGANFRCLVSGTPISGDYIKSEGKAGRIGSRLLAIVAEGKRGRVYLEASAADEALAGSCDPDWRPDIEIAGSTQYIGVRPYGVLTFGQLFTPRQLVALNTIADLISEAGAKVRRDAAAAGLADDDISLGAGGGGARAYSEAVTILLSFALDKLADLANKSCAWEPIAQCPRHLFGRQAIPMVWDYAEGNPLGESSGSWSVIVDGIAKAFSNAFGTDLTVPAGHAVQADAAEQLLSLNKVVSTDPPYYANVPYADLSDFFYVWARRSLRIALPELFSTIAVPKQNELVAFPHRHADGKDGAERFFLAGMTKAMQRLAESAHPAFPVTIYYAFKQAETEDEAGTASTGWETFLDAVIRAGFSITGTWPLRTENESRLRGQESNALASSIALVCRPRPAGAAVTSRRAFTRELGKILPGALDAMTRGAEGWGAPVAPVDLSQAIIGPGMEIFTKYASVLEADGQPMAVRTALSLINRFLADDDFDADTQFCLAWFEQHGWNAGTFGSANVLAQAKGTSVDGVHAAGVLRSGGGEVQLLRPAEYPEHWDPSSDSRLPVWELLHHLVRVLRAGGEFEAGVVLGAAQPKADSVRQLAYRLYTLCERAGWADDARQYNDLITSWAAIESAAQRSPVSQAQVNLFDA